MHPALVSPPSHPLFRIGKGPAPLEFPPWDRIGSGRFDDSRKNPRYRVLYAGERLSCFYECLAKFRPALGTVPAGGVPRTWLSSRSIGSLVVTPVDQHNWLDLTSPCTFHTIRRGLGALLVFNRLTDFDASAAMSERRALTNRIGEWAYEAGYSGILYATRHAPRMNCWAIFEDTEFSVLDPGSDILDTDVDLNIVSAHWEIPFKS